MPYFQMYTLISISKKVPFSNSNDLSDISLSSVAMEILEDDVRPDVVVVCCGGGGLVSGIAAAIKLSGLRDCRVYAVEPEGCKSEKY